MSEQTREDPQAGNAGTSSIADQLPLDKLVTHLGDYVTALGEKAIGDLSDKVGGMIDKLGAGASGDGGGALQEATKKGAEALAEGESPVKAGLGGAMAGAQEKAKQSLGGGSGGSGGRRFSNIVETIEVGVPLRVAYNQWTQFEDWTGFMKKVENVEQKSDEKVGFKGQVFLSHRRWESTITQQVPDEQIVWKSTGEKGHLDGAVTFHELGPRLTRILVVVEYYPQGFVEKTGNIWRAVGRRIRVELKRYVRHVMTETILDEASVEGWRGEIRDREVVRTHEEALESERAREGEDKEQGEQEQGGQHTDPDGGQPQDADEAPPKEDVSAEGETSSEEAASDEPPEEGGEQPTEDGDAQDDVGSDGPDAEPDVNDETTQEQAEPSGQDQDEQEQNSQR
ncbi:SRPBCC family protein [Citricoccus sp. GCM10030269]|uniref:SRPBCC family protein n=1 Tax=Citricoccus sp. GCM10030269 TaxID=3273388 RepID=UPI003619AFA1